MTHLMKIVLVGDTDEFREKFCSVGFQSKYMETIGVGYSNKYITFFGNEIIIQIWSLKDQGRFRAVRSVYYLGTLGAIVIFNVTRKETYDNLESWIKEIVNNSGLNGLSIVVIGNRIDLREDIPYSITDVMAEEFCKKKSEEFDKKIDIKYFSLSTTVNDSADSIFELLAKSYFEYLAY